MAAEHDDDAFLRAHRGHRRIDDAEEITRDEDVGKRLEKSLEGRAGDWRRRKLRGADLVRPARNGNSSDLREIRFGLLRGAQGLLGGAPVGDAGRYVVKYMFMLPSGRPDTFAFT